MSAIQKLLRRHQGVEPEVGFIEDTEVAVVEPPEEQLKPDAQEGYVRQ